MTQSATVKPDAELLAEIKARDAAFNDEDACPCESCLTERDRRTLLRLLSACQAMVLDWSLCRRILEQGMAIQQDYAAGKYPTYEHLQARLDEAARERVDALGADGGVKP